MTNQVPPPLRRASGRIDSNVSLSGAMDMDLNSEPEFLDLRAADASFVTRWAEESRLCGIIESEQTSPEEKYQALIDLAYLSGLLVHGLLDAARDPSGAMRNEVTTKWRFAKVQRGQSAGPANLLKNSPSQEDRYC